MVVLNYNNYQETIKFLRGVSNYTIINQIVVVDNCSTNNSFKQLKRYENNRIKIISSNKNGGYGSGNNIGLRYGIEKFNWEYVIISNPDVYFEENTISTLLNFINNNPNKNIGLLSPKMICPEENVPAKTSWKLPTLKTDITKTFLLLNKFFTLFHKNNNNLDEEYSLAEVIAGSFFLANVEALKKVNFLSEKTFLYCEERILAKKLMDLKYENFVLNNIYYVHHHSTTISKYNNEISKYKIYYESIIIYHKFYLKSNAIELSILKWLLKIGLIEKQILFKIKHKVG